MVLESGEASVDSGSRYDRSDMELLPEVIFIVSVITLIYLTCTHGL